MKHSTKNAALRVEGVSEKPAGKLPPVIGHIERAVEQ